jgi:hypothetical protein
VELLHAPGAVALAAAPGLPRRHGLDGREEDDNVAATALDHVPVFAQQLAGDDVKPRSKRDTGRAATVDLPAAIGPVIR